jgi:hypothetical protein
MPNRREFIQTSAVVSAIAANGVIARGAAAVAPPRAVALGRALYDDRYAEARRFAAVLGAQSVPIRALEDGDITGFWRDELAALGQREPVAIAGCTQFGPMFVVERWAAERGMRVALRVEHCGMPDGTLAHRFSGPRETLALAAASDALDSDWPALMAALAAEVAGDDSRCRAAERAARGPACALPPVRGEPFIHYYTPLAVQQGYGAALDGPLYSWVVAPRAQRG